MKPPPLTAAFLRTVKPPETGTIYLPDGACPGLRLRISSKGRMAWVLSCRDHAGVVRSVALGDLNGAGCIGLAEARERARRERQQLKDGRGSIAARKAARADQKARAAAPTLADLLALYEKHIIVERQKAGAARSWPEAKRAINSVLTKYLTCPLNDLTSNDLQTSIDNWPSRVRAGATVRFVRPVLKWGARRGLLTSGIAEMLQQPEGANNRRQRVLNKSEISAIWKALPITGACGNVFKWLFWTACRLSEATHAQWRDIDLEANTWRIPAANAKNGKSHIVPLPTQAIDMLKCLKVDSHPDTLLFPNTAGRPLDNWDRVTKKLMTASGTANWYRHDIRRTCATLLGDMGIMPHVIERVLGHSLSVGGDGSRLSPIASTYNHSSYQAEHAAALQALANHIQSICA